MAFRRLLLGSRAFVRRGEIGHNNIMMCDFRAVMDYICIVSEKPIKRRLSFQADPAKGPGNRTAVLLFNRPREIKEFRAVNRHALIRPALRFLSGGRTSCNLTDPFGVGRPKRGTETSARQPTPLLPGHQRLIQYGSAAASRVLAARNVLRGDTLILTRLSDDQTFLYVGG